LLIFVIFTNRALIISKTTFCAAHAAECRCGLAFLLIYFIYLATDPVQIV